jgi:hypothetical protein
MNEEESNFNNTNKNLFNKTFSSAQKDFECIDDDIDESVSIYDNNSQLFGTETQQAIIQDENKDNQKEPNK